MGSTRESAARAASCSGLKSVVGLTLARAMSTASWYCAVPSGT